VDKIRDIMTTEVVSVTEGMTIKDLCRILKEFDISGVPVVSEDGSLVGIVSEKDVIAHHVASLEPDFIDPDIYELISSKYPRLPDEFEGGQDRIYVEEIMNHDAVTVTPEASIEQASQILLEKQLHRLPVVEAGKVVGIVSSLDLLRAKIGQGIHNEKIAEP
jgi:CBS domain-containing protein